MPTLKEVLEGKEEKQPVPPKRPPATTPRPTPKPKERFNTKEYEDLLDAVDQYLRTYNNPKRVIKLDGKVDRANKRMMLLKEKLKKILNY
jgi:hypothetical protein